jgi:glycosyltransferase involved in cell wall biosynthesis
MNPFVAVQVATLARRNHCDVLHAMGIKGTLMARLATRMVPARTILHLHDLIEPGPLVGQLQRTFARDLDMAVCVASAAVPIAIHRYKVEPGRVRVIHNGIRLERYERVSPDARDRLRGSLGVSDRERVLMLVGRMHPIKGHRTMLRMMPGIIRQCAHAVLWLARELGLQDRIRFLGQRRDVPELLAACDVVVVPSQSEGLPIAAIEAHAAGRPVVGFDVGGVGEVVEDGASGRVVTAADEIAFIDAAAALLNDDPARAEYGATARARAQEFSLEAHVTQLVQCYRECAAAPAQ